MLIVHLVVAGIFLVLGTVFAFGKGAFLIADVYKRQHNN